MNILIADDDKISRTLLSRMLADEGAHVITSAADGEEAWQLLRGQVRFDLAMLDVMMPRLDGLDLLERIRNTPGFCELPVILCTAANDSPTVEKASLLSVNHYIVKPYTKATVLEKLRLVAAEVGSRSPADDFQVVAGRLGVSVGDLVEFTGDLIGEIRGWLARARDARQPVEFRRLAVSANGLKGASLNLGLRQLGRVLDAVDAKFTHEFTAEHFALFPPSPGEVAAAIETVAAEVNRVEQALARAA